MLVDSAQERGRGLVGVEGVLGHVLAEADVLPRPALEPAEQLDPAPRERVQ